MSQERFKEAVTVTVVKGLPRMTQHILSEHTLPTTVVKVQPEATATSPLPPAQSQQNLHSLPGWMEWVLRVGD